MICSGSLVMLTLVMLTRLEPDAVRSLRGFEELEHEL